MKQFIYDWIHLTQGEMFIKYWWLGLLTILVTILFCFIVGCWYDNVLIKSYTSKEEKNNDRI